MFYYFICFFFDFFFLIDPPILLEPESIISNCSKVGLVNKAIFSFVHKFCSDSNTVSLTLLLLILLPLTFLSNAKKDTNDIYSNTIKLF